MLRKHTIIIYILGLLVAFPAFPQPKKKIYITLDTSGSMYGDKYMISNYTAQLISVVGRNDDVYLICNGLIKKISGNEHAYKQIQFDYSLIRARWGMSSFGSQIGDIAAFNNEYAFNYNTEQWLFIIGDGNWESEKFTPIIHRFSDIVKQGNVNVFFIPYGNVNDGHSDFIDFIRTLKNPKILNESRQFNNIMSNCIIIYSYLTGSSAKNIRLNYHDTKTIKVSSPLSVKKYILYYQDETDEKQIAKPILAVQDSTDFLVSYIATPSTAMLRYKDNQTLISGSVWEIESHLPTESDVPLFITFNKPVDIKRLKLFPVYDLALHTSPHIIKNGTFKQNDIPYNINVSEETTFSQHNANAKSDSVDKISVRQKKAIANNPQPVISLIKNTPQPIQLQRVKSKDSTYIYRASVKTNEKIDTIHYQISIAHNKPLLFKKTTVKIDSDQITLTLVPRNRFSEAFIPDTLSLKATLTPKPYTHTSDTLLSVRSIALKAATTEPGTHGLRSRNKLLLVFFASIWLLYFFILTRKSRFKKGAVIDVVYANNTDKILLRKRGFVAWVNRWLNPFCAENTSVIFTDKPTPLTFTANRTKYSIRLRKTEFDENTMTYCEYSPSDGRHIEFVENRPLTLQTATRQIITVMYNSMPHIKDDRPIFSTCLFAISAVVLLLLIFI